MKKYGISPAMSGMLLMMTASWGLSYVAIRWLIGMFSPSWLLGIRFAVATLVMLVLLFFIKPEKRKLISLKPLLCGAYLYIAMYLQVFGLKFTTIAKSSFITTLFAFFVPILMLIFDKQKIKFDFWLLLFLSLLGIALMCDMNFSQINQGDVMTLFCALFCAFQIYTVGKSDSENWHPLTFSFYQYLSLAVLALGSAFVFEPTPQWQLIANSSTSELTSILMSFVVLIFLCTLIGFSLQIYAQKKIPSHIIGVVFLLESPFAAFFGFLLLGESMSFQAVVGASLVILSVGLVPYTERIIKRTQKIAVGTTLVITKFFLNLF